MRNLRCNFTCRNTFYVPVQMSASQALLVSKVLSHFRFVLPLTFHTPSRPEKDDDRLGLTPRIAFPIALLFRIEGRSTYFSKMAAASKRTGTERPNARPPAEFPHCFPPLSQTYRALVKEYRIGMWVKYNANDIFPTYSKGPDARMILPRRD